jgi:hypothetical protein
MTGEIHGIRVYVLYKDRLGSVSCLVLQIGPLYLYIYSPGWLNNTSIVFRQSLFLSIVLHTRRIGADLIIYRWV